MKEDTTDSCYLTAYGCRGACMSKNDRTKGRGFNEKRKKTRALHGSLFFGSVQMVMVSKNHGYKWLAVKVFTLSRLEHGWFRKNSVYYGPVYGS